MCRPTVPDPRPRKIQLRAFLQFLPAAAFAACPSGSAAQQQNIPRHPQGKPLPVRPQIHPGNLSRILQPQDMGPVLIKLQREKTHLVPHGEMGCHNGSPGRDTSLFRLIPFPVEGKNPGVLINPQIPGNPAQKFQRMEASLIREPDGPRYWERQRKVSAPFRLCPDSLQSIHFQIQRLRILPAIQKTVLRLKIAINPGAKFPVTLQGSLICPIIGSRPLRAESAQELLINHSMLRGDFCRRPGGNTGEDSVRLHKRIVNSPLF